MGGNPLTREEAQVREGVEPGLEASTPGEPEGGTIKPILVNTFSLNMLSVIDKGVTKVSIEIHPIPSIDGVRKLLEEGFISYISHSATAQFLTSLLGIQIPFNRANLILQPNIEHVLILVQLKIRLEEGRILSEEEVKELYNKGLIKFYKINLIYNNYEVPFQLM